VPPSGPSSAAHVRHRLSAGLKGLAGAAADALWPPLCLGCAAPVAVNGTLCGDCWPKLRFIVRPFCAACGTPFELDAGDAAVCGDCAANRPAWGRARAAVIYDDASKPLILGLKHGDRTEVAPTLGRWMAQAGGELLGETELLVPVPLHWTRLFVRRFNQAALLAHAIARRTGVPVAADALIRRRRTRRLGHLSPAARRRELDGAIAVRPGAARRIEERRIVVVDDVHTSGATLAACTRALLRGGAGHVDVLTFARAVKADPR